MIKLKTGDKVCFIKDMWTRKTAEKVTENDMKIVIFNEKQCKVRGKATLKVIKGIAQISLSGEVLRLGDVVDVHKHCYLEQHREVICLETKNSLCYLEVMYSVEDKK